MLLVFALGLLTLTASAYAGFLPPTQYATGRVPLNVARADVDLDGDADIIVCEVSDRTVSVMTNNGRGQFARSSLYTVKGAPVWAAVGNLDGDDYPDLAVADEMSDSVIVRLNDRTGKFGAPTSISVANPSTLALANVIGSGNLDLLVTDQQNHVVSVFPGTGHGGFMARLDYPVGLTPRSLAVGDMNADGMADVATVNYYGNSVSVLVNNGNGFAEADTYNVGVAPFCVDIGDVNGDAAPDLAVANMLSNNINVLVNNGSAGFVYAETIGTGSRPRHVSLLDVNDDGTLDITAANYLGNSMSTLLGTGSGGFSPSTTYPLGAGPWSGVTGDVDGDLKADIVTANRDGDSISVLRSNSSALSTTLGLTRSAATIDYGKTCTLTARLFDSGNASVVEQEVAIEKKTAEGWSKVGGTMTSSGGLVSVSVKPSASTTYRARFAGGAQFRSATSAPVTVKVRAYAGTPVAPSRVRPGRSFGVYGYLRPRHPAGKKSVTLYFYRYESGEWVLRKKVAAVNREYSSYTKYASSVSLPYRGRWRIRAHHADSGHAAAYSSYRYLTSR